MAKEKRGSTDRKIPTPLGYALDLLLAGHGWTALELADAAGVTDGTISAYIWGDSLTRERLEELASLMGLGPGDVSGALLAARLVLAPPPSPGSPVDPTPEERRIHREAATMVTGELLDLVLNELLRDARHENRRLALEEGRKDVDKLKTYSKIDQCVLIKGAPEYQQWAVAYVLCADSEAAAPHNPSRALELAELALLVSLNVQGTDDLKARLQGWCNGFVGNSRRVIGSSLPAAEQSFAEAWRLWRLGKDPAGLFSEAHLLDMEASLRRAQRQFAQALKLHDDALDKAPPLEAGSILINKAGTLQDAERHEEALEALARAAEVIDSDQQPRLSLCILFNTCSNLCFLGRATEAAPLIDEIRRIAERLRNNIDLIRALWLEASCALGLGQSKEALDKLNQVRHDFASNGLPFDYALATLDTALIYRDQGHLAAIKALAAETLRIFKAQGVHREAIAAVLLFQEAADAERVTIRLVRRLQNYFSDAKCNPALVFQP